MRIALGRCGPGLLAALLGFSPQIQAQESTAAPQRDLFAAVKSGDAALVRRALDRGADATSEDEFGLTAIHWAARLGDTRVLAVLQPHRPGVDQASSFNGLTALMIAAYNGHIATARELLHAGADPNLAIPVTHAWQNVRGMSPLYLAVSRGHTAMVLELVQSGARVPAGFVTDEEDAKPFDAAAFLTKPPAAPRRSLVREAAIRGDVTALRALLGAGGSAREAGALLEAARHGHAEAVQLLLSMGANVAGGSGSPLRFALAGGHAAAARALLDAGAPLTSAGPEQSEPSLLFAALMGAPDARLSLAMLDLLLERDAPLPGGGEICDLARAAASVGRAPLEKLIQAGLPLSTCWGEALAGAVAVADRKLMDWLWERRPERDIEPELSRAIEVAVRARDAREEVLWLLELGASPAARLENAGRTEDPSDLVSLAIQLARPGTLEVLLNWGAPLRSAALRFLSPWRQRKCGRPFTTPWNVGRVRGRGSWVVQAEEKPEDRLDVAAILIGERVDLEARDAAGDTALTAAASSCRADLVELLLEAGANPDGRSLIRDSTPLAEAAIADDARSIELLLEFGADARLRSGVPLPGDNRDVQSVPRRTPVEIARGLGNRSALAALAGETATVQTSSEVGRVPFACEETRAPQLLRTTLWPSPFAGSVELGVAIDDAAVPLSRELRDVLARHLLEALLAWTQSCPSCQPGSLSLVRIGETSYVESVCLDTLAGTDGLLATLPGYWCARQFRSARGESIFAGQLGYVSADSDATRQKIRVVCERDGAAGIPVLRSLQSALQCPGAAPGAPVQGRYGIRLIGRETRCGDDPMIIACGLPEGDIELNTQDWSFYSHFDGRRVFGQGAASVNLLQVLIHETGHWLGMNHSERAGSIMADVLSGDSCIGPADMEALGVAVDLAWAGRLAGVGALRAERP